MSQCLQSGSDRDALSGWGAVVFVMCASAFPCPSLVACCVWLSVGESCHVCAIFPFSVLAFNLTFSAY